MAALAARSLSGLFGEHAAEPHQDAKPTNDSSLGKLLPRSFSARDRHYGAAREESHSAVGRLPAPWSCSLSVQSSDTQARGDVPETRGWRTISLWPGDVGTVMAEIANWNY